MERHGRDKIELLIRIFGLYAGKKQFGQILNNPKRIIIFKDTKRITNRSLIANRRPGAVKSRRFTGTGKAGIIVLNFAGNRVSAEGAKRRLDLGRI
jgi:hypothetical protein